MFADRPLRLLVLEDTKDIVSAIQDLLEDHNRGGLTIEASFVASVSSLMDLVASHARAQRPFDVAWLDHRVVGPQTGADAYRFLRQTYGESILLLRIAAFDEPGYPSGSIFIPKVGSTYDEAIVRMREWTSRTSRS